MNKLDQNRLKPFVLTCLIVLLFVSILRLSTSFNKFHCFESILKSEVFFEVSYEIEIHPEKVSFEVLIWP